MSKQDVDAVIYAPLEEEYRAVQNTFPGSHEVEGEHYTGYLTRVDTGQSLLVITGFEWGNEAAKTLLAEVFSRFSPQVAISIGIAGAISKDASLGDVFYSKSISDLTQRQKVSKEKGRNRSRITYDPIHYDCCSRISKALDRSRLSISEKSIYKKWQEACSLRNRGKLASQNLKGLGTAPSRLETPVANNGQIASTNTVLADSNAVEDVKACGRKMACVDTESAGFACACRNAAVPSIVVIRGISDQADETKKLTEENFQNLFRDIAVSNATLFLKLNIDAIVKAARSDTKSDGSNSLDALASRLSENEVSIRTELSKRSIAFKALEKDLRVPVPRVLEEDPVGIDPKSKRNAEPIEIEDALEKHPSVIIDIPTNYPDKSLPWLYAHLLSEANLKGRFTVPICVREAEFGPPKNDLDAQLEIRGLSTIKNHSDYQIAFILIDPNPNSKTKSKFLKESFSTYSNASLLLVSDKAHSALFETDLVQQMAPAVCAIQDISFASIAHYVYSNFELPMDESEALASRLVSTFESHNLDVHPTYLVSIQKDTVLSFIEANQRGELIELAVAGILSFLVSDDVSKVVLRRTTRERFLSDLAVQIYCEKRNFTRADMESHVSKFAKEMGFDISPKQFVALFESNGILSFENGYADISVPVIKSYMLAKGLLPDPDTAISYFDLDDPNFDYSTFELYCEFTDDFSIYETVSKSLDHSITYFQNKVREYENKVEATEFHSHLLEKSLDLGHLSKDLKGRAAKIAEATNLIDEKQAQLDIQARIAKSQPAKEIDLSDREKFANEHRAFSRIIAAASLVGASAEKLTDQRKLDIMRRLIILAELISTDVITIVSSFDVMRARSEVVENIRKSGEITFEDNSEEAEFETFVELMISEWEYRRALFPIGSILIAMCESARTNVLLSPLTRVEVTSPIQEFFRTSWAFDMSPLTEGRRVRSLSGTLNRAAFLRTLFSIFNINRSYWVQGSRAKKAAISEAVNAMLKPLSIKTDALDD